MAGFVAVHCGAGVHSRELTDDYKQLCQNACNSALDTYKSTKDTLEAVMSAIRCLEDNALTNAGFGSNLTWEGTVECEASIMEGSTMSYGSCGVLSHIKNPIELAYHICTKQKEPMALGRVPPMLLVGEGAEKYATSAGIGLVSNESLISDKSKDSYDNNKAKVAIASCLSGKLIGPLDTVGAVFVSDDGRTSAGCSTGGIALKHCGRIGQAGTFAGGCWANSTDKQVTACSTSGCGEELIKTLLARQISEDLKADNVPIKTLRDTFTSNFLESKMLAGYEDRLAGAIAIKYDPLTGKGDVLWGHTTTSFCIGYGNSFEKDNQIECLLSRKRKQIRLLVDGASFKLRTVFLPPWLRANADEQEKIE